MATRHAAGWTAIVAMIGFAPGDTFAADTAAAGLSDADTRAVFKAAGAVPRKGGWVMCTDDPSASGAMIDSVRDLNGDGLPEVVLTEGGTYCYGHAGTGFQLLSKQPGGGWKVMAKDSGIPEFLKTHGANGWPDLSIGGPGFCFPVLRWNGKQYAHHRFEYEGKRCNPPR